MKVYVVEDDHHEVVVAYLDEQRAIDHMNHLNQAGQAEHDVDVEHTKEELYPRIRSLREYHYYSIEVTE